MGWVRGGIHTFMMANNDPLASQIAWFVFNNSGDAVVSLDSSGTIQGWNPAAEKIYGYGLPEIAGKHYSILFGRDAQGTEAGVLEQKLRSGETTMSWDTTQVHSNGSTVHIALDIRPLFTESGAPAGHCIVGKETTKYRMLQSQLRQTQKLEAVGLLSGGIAHDFNNLLMIISGYNNMIIEKLPAEDPIMVYALEVDKATERATMLTNQLLAFSRRQVTQPRVLNLNELVEDVNKMLRRIIGGDVELVLKLAPGLGNIKGDPGQLSQMLTNLVINARDAMPHGGVVTITTKNVDLDASETACEGELTPGAHVQLTIADSGTGMDEETAQHLFEPFFTTKPRGKGTGLGLSIVSGIVSQLRGNIRVSTELGKGTVFTIRLPVTKEEQTGGAVAIESRPRPVKQDITVLLLEDDAGVRHLIRHMLVQGGYTVYETSDPQEAARICETVPIKLLLTDVFMPLANGPDLAASLTKDRENMKVLYMSACLSDPFLAPVSLEPGFHFIRKPFTAARLYQHIDEIVGNGSSHRALAAGD